MEKISVFIRNVKNHKTKVYYDLSIPITLLEQDFIENDVNFCCLVDCDTYDIVFPDYKAFVLKPNHRYAIPPGSFSYNSTN